LAAGLGGQALLLAMVQGKRADSASKDVTQAQQQTEQLKALAEAHLKLLAATAQTALGGPTATQAQPVAAAAAAALSPSSPSAAIDAQLGAALVALTRASRPVRKLGVMAVFPVGGGGVWDRMRTILQEVFPGQKVVDVSLKQLGMTDDTRALLTKEIGVAWPALKPKVVSPDIKVDNTIDDLTNLVIDRGAL
jgi:hypothetical protein